MLDDTSNSEQQQSITIEPTTEHQIENITEQCEGNNSVNDVDELKHPTETKEEPLNSDDTQDSSLPQNEIPIAKNDESPSSLTSTTNEGEEENTEDSTQLKPQQEDPITENDKPSSPPDENKEKKEEKEEEIEADPIISTQKPQELQREEPEGPKATEDENSNAEPVPEINIIFYLIKKSETPVTKKKISAALTKKYSDPHDVKVGDHTYYYTVSAFVLANSKLLTAIEKNDTLKINKCEFILSSSIPDEPLFQIIPDDDSFKNDGDSKSENDKPKQLDDNTIKSETTEEKTDLPEPATFVTQSENIPSGDQKQNVDDEISSHVFPHQIIAFKEAADINTGMDKRVVEEEIDDYDDDILTKTPKFRQSEPPLPQMLRIDGVNVIGEVDSKEKEEESTNDKKEGYICEGSEVTFYLTRNKRHKKVSDRSIIEALRSQFFVTSIPTISEGENYYFVTVFVPTESPLRTAIREGGIIKISNSRFILSTELSKVQQRLPPSPSPQEDEPLQSPPLPQQQQQQRVRPSPPPPLRSEGRVTYSFLQVNGNTNDDFDTSALSLYLESHKFSECVNPADIRKTVYGDQPCYSFDVPYNPTDDGNLGTYMNAKIDGRTFIVRRDMEVYALVEKCSIHDVTNYIKQHDPAQVLFGNPLHPSTLLALIYQIVYGFPYEMNLRVKWISALINHEVKWVNNTTYWAVFDQKIIPFLQKRLSEYKGALEIIIKEIDSKRLH